MRAPIILFLRGYGTPDLLIKLANEHRISPDLYGRHLEYITPTLASRDLHSSPSLPSSSAKVFQLRIPAIYFNDDGSADYETEDLHRLRKLEADKMNKYLRQLRSKAKLADSIVRECHVLSRHERILEQNATVEIGRVGDSWRAVVWFDSGLDLFRSVTGVDKPWDPPATSRPWETYFLPVVVHPSRIGGVINCQFR
ncbi:hypothetical protein F5Y16DRAFT_399274 [Xylariaceae sp. FL0255]|nr:hypothetical protein F5Y16DRAFT_399274 [Xylariaceae sp. FL0255]